MKRNKTALGIFSCWFWRNPLGAIYKRILPRVRLYFLACMLNKSPHPSICLSISSLRFQLIFEISRGLGRRVLEVNSSPWPAFSGGPLFLYASIQAARHFRSLVRSPTQIAVAGRLIDWLAQCVYLMCPTGCWLARARPAVYNFAFTG